MNERERELRWSRLVELLQPIHGSALATARRLCRTAADGDDLYADTVIRAFDKLHTLRDESKFKSWFFATLLSKHRSRIRLRFWRRIVPMDDAFPAGIEPAGEDGSRWADDTGRARRVAAALATLPAEQREAIVLFELEGYRLEEIAAMQRASVPAVKSRLTRGRDRLRHYYAKQGITNTRPGRDGIVLAATPQNAAANHTLRLAAAAAFRPNEEEGPHD